MAQYALITGASKGIGREIALQLAARKYNLLLVARSGELLTKLSTEIATQFQVDVQYRAVDLSVANADEQVLNWVHQNNFEINILVNNAGYGLWGAFEKISLDDQLNMLQLNNTLLVKLTYKLLPLLKKHSRAYILNVASTASYQAMPYLGLYSASKALVVSFTRALRMELKNTGVSVTCLSPGGTETGFMDRAGMDSKKLEDAAARVAMTAADVARIGVNRLLRGNAEVIPGFVNKLTYMAAKFLPKFILESAVNNLYKP